MLRKLLIALVMPGALGLWGLWYGIIQPAASQPPDPEAIARSHLQQKRQQYGLRAGLDDLSLLQVRESLGGHHVRYQQTIDGTPVFGAYTTVSVSKRTGDVSFVLDRYRPGLSRDTAAAATAAVSQDEAIALARAAVGATELRRPGSATQVYFPVDDTRYLAWQVELPALHPLADWLVLVRADDGEVLLEENLMRFDTGKVFDPNPVVSSGYQVPPPSDCAIQDNALTLAEQQVDRTLQGIDDGQYKLKGEYVDLTAPGLGEGYGPAAGQADESSGVYSYACNDPRFEEAMVYYHIDKAQRKIQNVLGFSGAKAIMNRPQPVHAHFYVCPSANYSYLDRGIRLGDWNEQCGDAEPDIAEDADVILHEYGHAITDDQIPGVFWHAFEGETEALLEGFADFFAAAVNGDPCVGEWAVDSLTVCGGSQGRRWMQDEMTYSPFAPTGNPYGYATIWSGALWDLIEALEGETNPLQTPIPTTPDFRDLVLTLVLQSHFYLDPLASFSEAAAAILQADEDLFEPEEQHADTIIQVFGARNIELADEISEYPYAWIVIEHPYACDLQVRLKVGDVDAPLCEFSILEPGAARSFNNLEELANFAGTPCEPFLPPSENQPWFLEVTDVSTPVSTPDAGTINRFEVDMADTWSCYATAVPMDIPDDGTSVASVVDCTASRGLPTATPIHTATPTTTGTPPSTPTPTATWTPTSTPSCVPPFTHIVDNDTDCDGCADLEEMICADAPKPGATGPYDPLSPWDIYDVPVPSIANGGNMTDNRDSAVKMLGDVPAVLEYVGTSVNGPPNGNGRDYDDDIDGDTVKDGVAYDRSVGPPLDPPPDDTGPPDGHITLLTDVLLVMAQVGVVDCSGPP